MSAWGGQTTLSVKVRLVAATHCDLHEMVRRRTFREDLWYRISVFPVHLPPLRERAEDIPVMASHFALKAAKRLGLPPALPTQEDLSLLVNYPWPGNVRELLSVIERAAILGNGRCLEIAKALGVSGAVAGTAARGERVEAGDNGRSMGPISSPELATLEQVMIRRIQVALETSHGRIEGPFGAAKALGINPHTLRARMRKLGVDWKQYRN
ncbi:MAG TPA: sigma 54-interacting transcriptional regulator [Tepidisphaeraceae bacterium]|nr:sigma 54-interacting transcriptional regulator [Tepidisphaeraceae bacterium]